MEYTFMKLTDVVAVFMAAIAFRRLQLAENELALEKRKLRYANKE